jgi:hypothetical protein
MADPVAARAGARAFSGRPVDCGFENCLGHGCLSLVRLCSCSIFLFSIPQCIVAM